MITLSGGITLDALACALTAAGIKHGYVYSEYTRGERATPYSDAFPGGYSYYIDVDVDPANKIEIQQLAAIVEAVNAAHPHLTPVTDYRLGNEPWQKQRRA
jgi:hypothetical protein